jgi:hypothetical protein
MLARYGLCRLLGGLAVGARGACAMAACHASGRSAIRERGNELPGWQDWSGDAKWVGTTNE